MTQVTSQATQSPERINWKDEYSDKCRKLAGIEQTLRHLVVSPRHEQQWPKKLGGRQTLCHVFMLYVKTRQYRTNVL